METTEHKELKQKLLNREISFIEVREKLALLEQCDTCRVAPENNLAFLDDTEIIDYIESVEDEIKNEYFNFLGCTEFHVAQRLAFDAENELAISHLEKALGYSENMNSSLSWNNYICGTILYLKGMRISEELIEGIEEERNAEILRNLNDGLHKRGYPSYMIDYAKY